MSKGPRLNNISRNFTTRDSLGIEGIANTISAEICPIVNTVTPRPFYWALINWCYYDFYKNCKLEERNTNNVYKYVKRQNYYMALATLLNGKDEVGGFTGTDTLKQNGINLEDNVFKYNDKYLKNLLSNMGYYPAGLLTMGFIVEEDPDTSERFKYPKLTPEGEKLGQAFENVIKDTEYYKRYRLTGLEVPKNVLLEFGKIINMNLDGFNEVEEILRDHLFNRKNTVKLIDSHNYIKYLFYNEKIVELNISNCREIFFDYYSPLGEYKKKLPNELKDISNEWEIVIGRQYFTVGLEMIWKYMIEMLNVPKTYQKWFSDCLNLSEFKVDISNNLSCIINDCNFTFKEREEMISKAKSKNDNHINNIENGLKIILSIYNRFNNRDDISIEDKQFFDYGIERDSISLNQFFNLVEEYKNKSIKEFIEYIMYNYLFNQHKLTAFGKMVQGRDGYYIEQIENEYVRKESFDFDFQGIRAIQLMSVMKDLNILEVISNV